MIWLRQHICPEQTHCKRIATALCKAAQGPPHTGTLFPSKMHFAHGENATNPALPGAVTAPVKPKRRLASVFPGLCTALFSGHFKHCRAPGPGTWQGDKATMTLTAPGLGPTMHFRGIGTATPPMALPQGRMPCGIPEIRLVCKARCPRAFHCKHRAQARQRH